MKTQTLHLKAPDNWVNDPNGFIYYNGYYHLFYQYFPYGPRWGTMHWGHAVSRDLVTWEHKGIALYPSTMADQNGCFSGSAIEEDGKLYLFYTGVRYEVVNPEDPHTCLNEQFESTQLMIFSEDGFHFDNEHGKEIIIPPITDPALGSRTHTRDPKIWRGKDAWYLILGSTVEEEYGEVLFYRSEDLHTWTYVNKGFKGKEYGWMWECPDLFRTKGGDVLFLSAMGLLNNGEKERNQSICFPATFNEESCSILIPDKYQYLDYGMDLYAPQTTLDQEGRRIMTAWLRMPKVTPGGWIGMFCLPRVVEIQNGHIFFRIHPNIRNAYSQVIRDTTQLNNSDSGYLVSFTLSEGEKINIGGYLISRKENRIITDRSAVYPAFEGAHLISESPDTNYNNQDGSCRLDVIVDSNLIEVYINDGEYVISNTVYELGKEILSNIEREIRIYAY